MFCGDAVGAGLVLQGYADAAACSGVVVVAAPAPVSIAIGTTSATAAESTAVAQAPMPVFDLIVRTPRVG
ncbi:hypothetical protein GCM10010116_16350 [Microbispora rosea subsp. aerata]|nr:hypothetical protein GCM10010116_16350 [Microbispora rosea subsp. aerata]